MNKHIIKIDTDFAIIAILNTFDYTEEDIEITAEEFEQAKHYKKFDPATRKFSEPIPQEEPAAVKTNEELQMDIEVLSQAITELSMIMAATV